MISDRKLEHLLICKNYDVEFKNKKTGFEDVELIHKALPEIDKNEIDLSTSVFGKKLDSPLFITLEDILLQKPLTNNWLLPQKVKILL